MRSFSESFMEKIILIVLTISYVLIKISNIGSYLLFLIVI